jgi:hypothetical protein
MHSLLDLLRRRGWTVQVAEPPLELLPAPIAARYAGMPREVASFLAVLEACCSGDGTAWLFTSKDYARTEEGGFRWNECELMAMSAAAGNATWQDEIRAFWNDHFPFMLAVHSDYDYLAVRMQDGAVVHGYAPEWESPTVVAPCFSEFLRKFEVEATAPTARWPYAVFLGAPA